MLYCVCMKVMHMRVYQCGMVLYVHDWMADSLMDLPVLCDDPPTYVRT